MQQLQELMTGHGIVSRFRENHPSGLGILKQRFCLIGKGANPPRKIDSQESFATVADIRLD